MSQLIGLIPVRVVSLANRYNSLIGLVSLDLCVILSWFILMYEVPRLLSLRVGTVIMLFLLMISPVTLGFILFSRSEIFKIYVHFSAMVRT